MIFGIQFYHDMLQIKFEFCSGSMIFCRVMELGLGEIRKICFPDFFLSCFNIFKWYLVYSFIMTCYRSSSNFVPVRWFFAELWTLDLGKFEKSVFQTFFLHASTYSNDIWYTVLSWHVTDQVRILFRFDDFWQSYGPWTWRNSKNQFSGLFFVMLWHIQMIFSIQFYHDMLQIKFEFCSGSIIFCRVMDLGLGKIRKISFPDFFSPCFEILKWYLVYSFIMICYTSSSTIMSISLVLLELWPFMSVFSFPDFFLSCFELLNSKLIWSFNMKSYRSSLSFNTVNEFL